MFEHVKNKITSTLQVISSIYKVIENLFCFSKKPKRVVF